jgi:hypothetical protein
MAWKFPQTVERVVLEAEIVQLLREASSLSEFELRDQILVGSRAVGRCAEQNAEMFKAALRTLARKELVSFEGRYRVVGGNGSGL